MSSRHTALYIPAAAGGPTTTQISASFSAVGSSDIVPVSTTLTARAFSAVGTSSLLKNVKKFFTSSATGTTTTQKTTSLSRSIGGVGTFTETHGIVNTVSSSATGIGNNSSSEIFIAGVPTFKFIKGIILKGIAMIGKLITGKKI